MNNRSWITALAVVLLPQAAWAGAADLNVIKTLQVAADGTGARVTIVGTKAPTYTVFKLPDPARLVVDVAGADVSAVQGGRGGQGPVANVNVSQFADERTSVGRVVIALNGETGYDVRAAGNDVVVTVPGAAGPSAAAASPSAAATAPELDDHVVGVRRDQRDARNPGQRLTAVSVERTAKGVAVNLSADGEIGTFEEVQLKDPPRLAIDLVGFEKGLKAKKSSVAPVREVRFGRHEGKVRMVIDAGEGALPEYRVERTATGLKVAFSNAVAAAEVRPAAVAVVEPKPSPVETKKAIEAKPVAVAAETKPVVEPKPVVEAKPAAVAVVDSKPAPVVEAKPAKLAAVRDVTFNGDESRGRVVIAVPKGVEHTISRPDPRTAVLTLEGASLPKRLERSLDTSAFGGPVRMVSSFAAPGQPGSVQIVAMVSESTRDRLTVAPGGELRWEFSAAPSEEQAEAVIDGKRFQVEEESAASAPRTGAFAAGTAARAGYSSIRATKSGYSGRRVSFEFKDIDIHNLLRIIAEVSKKNLVVADNVSGKITIRLRNVPWDQALDLILKSKGLDKDEIGNIIRIAPAKELEEERRMASEKIKAQNTVAPLKVRIIPVNYATAAELQAKIKDVLSERGTLTVDARTNVIIVKDTVEALARAEGLVRRLDTQTPQVLIEGRIVEANATFSREFGIQWGGNVSLGPATGNPTGLLFPNVVRIAGANSPEGNVGTSDTPNFAVNMPAPIGMGSGGGLGFIFGSAGGAVALNLRLSAMEASGHVKTISAPKVTTLDNTPARIGQGVSMPFSQVSASGVNTAFIEAKLELSVTPHVTADGSVLLTIQATNNQPDPGTTGANGQPSISKKEANTQVLVKDGDTTVIGGIYTRTQGTSESAVPIFSKIPVLGWLFKKQREVDSRTELLIFITPRIINRSQIVSAAEGAP